MKAKYALSAVAVALGSAFAAPALAQNVQFIPAATLTAAGYNTNQTPGLPGYSSVDLVASRDIGKGFQVFFGAQNLVDTVYFVQTNPSTVGTPRMITGGVRVRWTGR